MAYRVNAQFTDNVVDGWLSDVVAAPAPRCGETISICHHGRDVGLYVAAVWRSAPRLQKRDQDGIVMVEAVEVGMQRLVPPLEKTLL